MSDAPDTALVKAVRKRLTDESAWTKGFAARDASGEPTQCDLAEAACFCIVGAFWRESGELNNIRASNAFAERLGFWDWESLARWNDDPSTAHADILARLDAVLKGEATHG